MEVYFPEAFNPEFVKISDMIPAEDAEKYTSAAKRAGIALEFWENSPETIEVRVERNMDLDKFYQELKNV